MKRIVVFCGSSPGGSPGYVDAARELGELLATRGIGVVYGGASIGLMGAVADAALAAGGEVIGVIPSGLFPAEIPHAGLTEQYVVESMHERKALMAELSDAVIALPGGSGTLDELFEMFTWSQLGLHRQPIGLLDVAGYWKTAAGLPGPRGRRAVHPRRAPRCAARQREPRGAARRPGRRRAVRAEQVDGHGTAGPRLGT